ncbi:MAG TPA: DUF2007 domain-containing protein [Dehalococcoidia bacterium]|nr:DUF2007 domain-containing protein [Dehalococcoidia bacterium]
MNSWINVATAPDQLTAEIWIGILQEEGIDAMLRPADAISFMGLSRTSCGIQVRQEDESRAREIIEDIEN